MDFLEQYQEARAELKPYLLDYARAVLKKSKGRNMFVCPFCGSGEGSHHTGAFSIDEKRNKYKCFNGACDKKGDIVDLYKHINGTDEKAAVKELCAMYGVSYPGELPEIQTKQKAKPVKKEPVKTEPEQETDFTPFFFEAHNHITETDYWKKRGLSEAVINKFMLGYVKDWRHPKTPQAPTSPRLIIPISAYSYTARDTRAKLTPEQESYKKQKASGKEGANWIFNIKALTESKQPIFVLEGELDAMSIYEAGGEAVGTGSTAFIEQLINGVKELQPTQPLIICLDNDAPGQKAQAKLEEGLKELNIPFYRRNVNGSYKDANDYLIADREGFIKTIRETVEEVKELERVRETMEKEKAAETSKAELTPKEEYIQKHCITKEKIQAFFDSIPELQPPQPTGFKELDSILEGGLYPGCLYVIGAISSLGKTTFTMQIADQIAQRGQEVIIFSLEMAAEELIAKSISRETFIEAERVGRLDTAKTQTGLLNCKKWREADKETIINAVGKYADYAAGKIEIRTAEDLTRGGKEKMLEAMKEIIKEHIAATGSKPTVIIDYLQILALLAQSERRETKAQVDASVWEFKTMARAFNIPVIAVSSFNRDNYNTKANLAAFKESGAIEYSADTCIALQLKGVDTGSNFDADKAMMKEPREIELVILKGRRGKARAKINYCYYPKFNYFQEGGAITERKPI